MEFLAWLENSALGQWVASDPYAEPLLLCAHAIGMGVVVGVVWMLDLRILGLPPRYPLRVFEGLRRVAWAGFGLNLVSGAILFTGSGTRLIVNLNFQLKMAAIALGGLSIWALARLIRGVEAGGDGAPVRYPASAQAMAAVSGLLWLGAIFTGRYIAYTLAPPAFL